jgi:hypothetical protein
MDENKRIMHDSKGQPILSDYLIREKKKKVDLVKMLLLLLMVFQKT